MTDQWEETCERAQERERREKEIGSVRSPCKGCNGVGFLYANEAWEIGYWCPRCLGTGVEP